ncbi:MAG TPA: DUF2283 domain-containing protein [Leptospiraceae bacterium]|nr:DUF2283 domain-containing protein [Leptospiraceae bacterium]HMY32819.1 DUF2283 domain-containing protein [Leptospiraceae bacterium]HMZ67524.1 DUF2283 domain-containing protein [Leptospiraceae bacterium]HNA08159.1 DUF2283 domain-containing protein [Leptospiraceae bacterium]HNC01710.1 DUF2283 domain-containing protein [Leptospiraceae bacterium]
MQVTYDSTTDLLYIRIDSASHQITNKRITDDIVLDLGEDGKIVGIEILDASKQVNLSSLLPISIKQVA